MIVADQALSDKTITILGSTGSIGLNTIQVLEKSPVKYKVKAITAANNASLLAEQAIALGVDYAVIANNDRYKELKKHLSGSKVKAMSGYQSLYDIAGQKVDYTMSAIVGSAGLIPTMNAIKAGNVIALANKECLVCAGDIMIDAAKGYNSKIIPVDSEHNAIFQVFDFERTQNVSRIILTASGGPFLNLDIKAMDAVKPVDAVRHPNWNMGAKISVDSATMMNKGLELIEAYYLFPVEKNQIDVIIHPQSVIHSMVEYIDGSTLAQLGTPDMCTPISVALSWPGRINLSGEKLNLSEISSLTFSEVDHKKFPALDLAKNSLSLGGCYPIILNTANEIAVEKFLQGKINFTSIAQMVEKALNDIEACEIEAIDDVIDMIALVMEKVG